MREDGDASDKPLDIAVLSRMKQFRAMNKLKKLALKVRMFDSSIFLLAYIIPCEEMSKKYILNLSGLLQVIAENLSEEEIVGLKEMFKSMDTDNSGTITFEELKAGLPKLGTKLSESEVRQYMEAVSSLIPLLSAFSFS